MATEHGTVKKTVLSAYGNVRKGGINAINLKKNDRLIEVKMTDGTNDIMIGTRSTCAVMPIIACIFLMELTANPLRVNHYMFVPSVILTSNQPVILLRVDGIYSTLTNISIRQIELFSLRSCSVSHY